VSDESASHPVGTGPVIDHDGTLDAGVLGPVAWVTDVGHARKRNEDRLLVKRAFDGRFLLLVVADGAGGHTSGDKAAEMVVRTLDEVFRSDGPSPEGPPAAWLNDVIMDIHEKVRGLAEGENRPPASTLVGLLIEEETLCGWRFHVGDSRLYGRRDDAAMMTWTRDHNITNGLIDRGLPAAQALKIAEGGKLTQVMGGGADPEPDIRGPFQLAGGDSFLICSDGVFGYNDDRDPLSDAIDPGNGPIEERAQALKAAVLAGDALDNLTAVLWDVPAGATPARKRLGLIEPYDRQDVSTMVDITAHRPGADRIGPSGPPPPPSMPKVSSISDADLAKRRGGPSQDDLDAAQRRLDEAASSAGPSNPGLKLGMIFMATLAILALLVWARGDDSETMTVDEMEQERARARAMAGLPPEEPAAAEATPAPKPVTADPSEVAVTQLLAGFTPGWWDSLDDVRREQRRAVLRELLATRGAEPTTLSWEAGEPPKAHSVTIEDWPAAGGDNAEIAATAWSARGRVLGLHGDLASQPGVDELLRSVACEQVRLRWPRGQSAGPGDAVQLPSWLSACLPPDADGADVSVRLGGYPDVGWTDEDWNELRTLADSPGGAGAITRFDHSTWNPRLVELGQLTLALSEGALQEIQVEVRVVLDPSDPVTLAQERADRIGKVLEEGSGGALTVSALGINHAPLVDAAPDLLPGQASHVAGLNRRVEITLFRSSSLELDEMEMDPPDDAPSDEAEGEAAPDAGASSTEPK